MSDRPKRWPIHAERYRIDALCHARNIRGLVSQVDQAITDGNGTLALLHLSKIDNSALEISTAMLLAKQGR